MCKAGGPRCTRDTEGTLITATHAFEKALTDAEKAPGDDGVSARLQDAQRALVKAQLRYDSSPGGLADLEQAVADDPMDLVLRRRLERGFATRLAEYRQHDQREGRVPRDAVPMTIAGRRSVKVAALHMIPVERATELAALDAEVRRKAEAAGRTAPDPRAMPVLHELHPSDAHVFAGQIQALRQDNPYAASVYVYPDEEYAQMRTLLTADGTAGVAVKSDGDIVSVFSRGGHKRVSNTLIATAVESGGRKLDCFNTILPTRYAEEGFVETGRVPWDDQYRPDGWNEAHYAAFNGGRPDVVFMEYDKEARIR